MTMSSVSLVVLVAHGSAALRVPFGVRCSATGDFRTHPQWTGLQAELDQLPAFTCVNENGEPLGYERDGEPIAIFFGDVDRAQQELDMATGKFPQLNLRLMGVGLGDVHRRVADGTAMLVPSAEALAGAGDDFPSEKLPLYTCLRMSTRHADGSQRTPLFMDPKDAQASLDRALEAAVKGVPGGILTEQQKAELSLVCTSLDQAIDLVLSGNEKEACEAGRFSFVAPNQSLKYLQGKQGGKKEQAPEQRAAAAAAISGKPDGTKKSSAADASNLIFPS